MNLPRKTAPRPLSSFDICAFVLAALVAAGGIARVVSEGTVAERLDETTLKYFIVAGALLLLRKIKTLSFGDYSAQFAEVEAKAEEALEQAKDATSIAAYGTAAGAKAADTLPTASLGAFADPTPGDTPDDPWKNAFGGKAIANGRRLDARVVELPDQAGWFRIILFVRSTSPLKPLNGEVMFFLHPTYPDTRPRVPAVNGVAELRLRGWGAFTVGAICDGGATRLELDLAELADAPELFRSR